MCLQNIFYSFINCNFSFPAGEDEEVVFACPACDFKFTTVVDRDSHFDLHIDEHIEKHMRKCPVKACDFTCDDTDEHKEHLVGVHQKKVFECNACAIHFITETAFKKHNKLHPDSLKTLNIERKPSRKRKSDVVKLESEEKSNVAPIDVPEQEPKSSDDIRDYLCRFCNEYQSRSYDMDRHESRCKFSPQKEFNCKVRRCNKKVYGSADFITHMKTDHNASGSAICLYCFRLCATKKDAANHSCAKRRGHLVDLQARYQKLTDRGFQVPGYSD